MVGVIDNFQPQSNPEITLMYDMSNAASFDGAACL